MEQPAYAIYPSVNLFYTFLNLFAMDNMDVASSLIWLKSNLTQDTCDRESTFHRGACGLEGKRILH